jgi:hypothetical protein
VVLARQFVDLVRKSVLVENVKYYEDVLENEDISRVTYAYWRRLLTLYRKLDERDRKILLDMARQVCTDSISNVFGLIDGVVVDSRDFDPIEFRVRGQSIEGTLQDIFLEMIEMSDEGLGNSDPSEPTER